MRAFTFEFKEFSNINFEIKRKVVIEIVDSKLPEFSNTLPYPAS